MYLKYLINEMDAPQYHGYKAIGLFEKLSN